MSKKEYDEWLADWMAKNCPNKTPRGTDKGRYSYRSNLNIEITQNPKPSKRAVKYFYKLTQINKNNTKQV